MRKFLYILFTFVSLNSWAESKNLGLDAGAGFRSNYGLVGFGARYFVEENIDLHFTSGIDITGVTMGLGSRYYIASFNEKCFFFIPCKARYFAGATVQRTASGDVTVKEDSIEGNYKQTEGLAGNISAGSYDIFGDSFTMGLEIGYRSWMKRPDVKFKSGTYLKKHNDELEDNFEDSITLALALGWIF